MAPGNTTALTLRGAELASLHRDEEALEAFDEILAQEPGDAMAHYNRAMALTLLDRRQEAVAALDQAVACAPDEAFFHARKGIALVGLGDLESALAELDAACCLQPKAAGEAEAWAAAILWHRGDDRGARERFGRVKGRVTGKSAFDAAELEAIARCGLGDPGGAERALGAAKPRQGPADQDRLAPLYDLLSAPPLAGVDQLRVIATADR
jgi:tetratricopeptide (TPR) repeat protein